MDSTPSLPDAVGPESSPSSTGTHSLPLPEFATAPALAPAGPAASAPPASAGEPAVAAPPSLAAAELAAVPPQPPLLKEPTPAPFAFHGEAREYFRIWIVNTLLSLLTLGVFVAWAKVRKRRYLRASTEFLGHRFLYTADPRRILVGNLIVLVLFLAYALFGSVYPWIRFTALGVGVLLLPWIVVRSLAFNAHHTVYRGLRFHFHPSLSAAVMVYLLKPLLIPVTLGFYSPAWVRAKQEFFIGRHRLGTGYFNVHLPNGPFYRAYLIAGATVFATVMLMGFASFAFTKYNAGHAPSPAQMMPLLVFYGAVFYAAKHFIFAQLFNPTWNAVRLDGSRFHASLHTGRWLGLQLVNLGAIIGSAGLLYPWAVVRSTRYALSCLALTPADDFETIARMGEQDGSAVGDTAAEFVGLDFGL